MARYLLECKVGLNVYKKEVTAKNMTEARAMAADYAYECSEYGNRFYIATRQKGCQNERKRSKDTGKRACKI